MDLDHTAEEMRYLEISFKQPSPMHNLAKENNIPSPWRSEIILVLSKHFGARLEKFGPETSSVVKSHFWRCPKHFPLVEIILYWTKNDV